MKRLLCMIFLGFGVACSDDKPPSLDIPTDMAMDAATDQGSSEDVSLDQNEGPDLAVDMQTDASDMTSEDDMPSEDQGVDAQVDMPEDMEPDDSVPVDLSCAEHADCGKCLFPTAPTSIADCYCTACPDEALPVDVCQANQMAWESICGNDDTWQPNGACPLARCIAPTPAACINEVCIDACSQSACPVLTCPQNEQVIPPGECCARCTGANTCVDDSDCTQCSYSNLATQPNECQCPLCPTHPTTQTECQDRQSAYNTHCDADFQLSCPIPLCLPSRPVTCGDSGYCEGNAFACQDDVDCGYCPFAVAPTNASECACEGCGVPMTNDECAVIMQQVNDVCDGFNFNACIPTPCAAPPELSCDFFAGGVCTRNDL